MMDSGYLIGRVRVKSAGGLIKEEDPGIGH